MKFFASARGAIFQNDGREIVTESIHGGHQHTDFRGNSCHDDRIHTEGPKGLIQVGFEEGAKAPLGQNNISRRWL